MTQEKGFRAVTFLSNLSVKHASVSLCKTSIGGSKHGTEMEKKSEKKHRNW